ncbi:13551_t:CDS:2 [Funneliformis mosseae]|uniref:13551_t:CDS:1 n=1 Tax=Funneliformis mosseae TaxID=27381 RepID=A0A9N9AUA9_FUNMO|nr:13551_t:CDS:2 [Funneliformis mosseae]
MIESYPRDDQYKIPLNLISDISILENQVAALSIRQAVDGINQYLIEFSTIHEINLCDHHQFPILTKVFDGKMKELQDKGFGKIKGSAALI